MLVVQIKAFVYVGRIEIAHSRPECAWPLSMHTSVHKRKCIGCDKQVDHDVRETMIEDRK